MQLVAEIGASHNNKLNNVFRLMKETTEADAFKIQTWSKDSMAIPGYKAGKGPWSQRDLQELYRKARLPWSWHSEIFEYAKELEKIVFSSPFDHKSVDFLERLDCPAYKIASFEVVDLPLVTYAAQTGKPIILSTGQVQPDELKQVIEAISKYNNNIMLLHCVSQYPTNLEQANVGGMLDLRKYGYPVGISDHSKGDVVPIVATALGASMIEKHIGRHSTGLDGSFSMRPYSFNSMARKVRDACKAMLNNPKEPDTSLRRSLYFTQDLPEGTILHPRHLKTARPNKGLSPLLLHQVLGQTLTRNVIQDHPLLTEHLPSVGNSTQHDIIKPSMQHQGG